MQFAAVLSLLALTATAINAAPAPTADTDEPYLKVRNPGCQAKRDPNGCYAYIKRSEVPALIARDNNNVEETYARGWLLPCQSNQAVGWVFLES